MSLVEAGSTSGVLLTAAFKGLGPGGDGEWTQVLRLLKSQIKRARSGLTPPRPPFPLQGLWRFQGVVWSPRIS